MSSPEVLIVGAGPAGSTAALLLARRGYDVRVIEKNHFPRPKLCGGFISPIAAETLAELQIPLMDTIPHRDIRRVAVFASDGVGFSTSLRSRQRAYGVSRAEFDDGLARLAREAGASFNFETRVRAIQTENDTVGVQTDADEYTPQFVIGSGGRSCPVRRHFTCRAPGDGRVGMAYHFRDTSDENSAAIGVFPTGYGGILHMGGDRLNLCFVARSDWIRDHGADDERLLRDGPFRNPELNDRAGGLERIAGPFSTTPIYLPPAESPHPRILLAGDAAGFVEPFTGYGIAKAIRQGAVAADILHARLSGGTNGHPLNGKRQQYSESVLHLLREAANQGDLDAMVHDMARHPHVARIMVRSIYAPSVFAGWLGERLLRMAQ